MLLCSILGGILLLLVLLLFLPTEVDLDYKLENKLQSLRIRLRILTISISFKVPINEGKKQGKKNEKKQNKKAGRQVTPKSFIAFCKELHRIYIETEDEWMSLICEIRKHLSCKDVSLSIWYGTTNPARTGILNGAVWTAGSLLLKLVDAALLASKKSLYVYPEFNRTCMCIHSKGTFRFKMINAFRNIWRVMKLVRLFKSKITIEF
ncbi:MAG: DUF2953 domain-containing protein [Ruminococcaceae bacterium]|nr:DUF2953 domain-containing protein [Oscillospiraceae bacterium]